MKRQLFHSAESQGISLEKYLLYILVSLLNFSITCASPEGHYEDPDTGSIALQVIWPEQTSSDQGVIVSDLTCPACTEFAGSVYAADMDYVYFNFPFDNHYGTVYDVPSGNNRCVYADARDGSGNVYYNGDSCGIYVPAGGSSGTVYLMMRTIYGWLAWEDPPNNDMYEADYITDIPSLDPEVTITGDINPEGDVDWFYFWINAGTTVGFDCDADEYDSYMDCELTLYDSGGGYLTSSDDDPDPDTGWDGLDSYISYTFPSGGYYYLKINDLGDWGGYGFYYNINVRQE